VVKKLGKYELIEEVGRGAMGQVYKAYDPLIGRHVALKTITNSLVGDPDLLERFYREARAAGTLQHPNIVTVYELVREGGTPFIAMEFLEGEALEKIVRRRADLSIAEKVGLIVPVCRALEYAHKRGFVHRDIKPGNVMVTKDGNVKVVDFGIARFGDSSKTETNLLIGTPGYMSPQQIKGEKADERADIWALGVSFYELLCHRRPFEAENQATLMFKIIDAQTPPAPMSELLPGCPPAVEAIVMKLLRKDIEQRFQTMEEVLIEIEPVWKHLQEESVAGLIQDAEKLIEAQDFSRARDLLRKCLGIDGRNERAKVLVEQINEEMKQNRVLFQVRALLARAQELLESKCYPEAEAEAEAALRIDPTSVQVRELLAEVNRLSEKNRLAQQGLQTAKKRVAEGELTRAALEVEKVLQMEADNPQARALQRQIQDLADRREERRQAEDTLQRARKFWAELRFDECIALLTTAGERFPGDSEIEKLLETVKHDQTEQDKQQKLVQVRGLLAQQRADDALGIIECLVAVHPNDQAVQTAYRLVLRESENLRQKERFQRETAELRKLMDEGKFSEAASRGEKLLQEFPQEAELTELVSYAREESARFQRRQSLEEALADIREKTRAEQYRDAVIAAEIALARFPHDPGLKAARQEAVTQQQEKEKRELFQRRIEEIRGNINRGQYTDAVDLARQTLSTLGRNDQVTQLLLSGEMELAEKRRQQGKHQRELTEATQSLSPLRGTQAVARIVWDGLERLRHRGPKLGAEAAPDATLNAEKSPEAQQGPPTNADPAQDYVFQQGAGPTQTASPSTGANALPSLSPIAMISGRRNPEIAAEDVARMTDFHPEQPIGIVSAVPNVYVDACRRFSCQIWRQASGTANDQPILCGVFVSVIVFGLGTYFLTPARPLKKAQVNVHSVDTKNEIELFNRAQQLEQQKQWPEAQAAYENLARREGTLTGQGREGSERLRELLYQENSLLGQAKAQLSVDKFSAAKGLSERVAALHGDREQEAIDTLQKIVVAESAAADRKRKVSKEPVMRQALTINEQPAAQKQLGQTEAENCQLLSTNIPIYLDRADSDRARGNYIDAERLYGDVLACDSKNERANTGLDKSRQAKALPNRHN